MQFYMLDIKKLHSREWDIWKDFFICWIEVCFLFILMILLKFNINGVLFKFVCNSNGTWLFEIIFFGLEYDKISVYLILCM